MNEIFFSKEHAWVRIDGSVATAGISTHAADELGDVTFVELPQTGKQVKQGEVASSIESVKAASDIYSPVSGTVTEVNSQLDDSPELINESPEELAWVMKIEMNDPSEVKNLMDAGQYASYLESL